ncbi:hypothetical protein GLYMA_06G155066v4 [Glycine max]|nr:hypothetical protein GLYMA_06G155066v4 [Glycine max]KAH1126069.1 hypothetical protein GYH30_015213 [Glycine max]
MATAITQSQTPKRRTQTLQQSKSTSTRPVIMGNSESMYESQDNFYQHPPSYNNSYHQPSPYAENSENNTYHEPSSYAGTSSNTSYYQPSTHPGSSANTRHQHI